MKETIYVDGNPRSFKVRHNVMSELDLAVNAVNHYYLNSVNDDGSRFVPLSLDKNKPRNFYSYFEIVKKNIDEMINDHDLNRVLSGKGSRVQEVEIAYDSEMNEGIKDYFIIDNQGIFIKPGIDMELVNYNCDDEFKGLLKLALDKSYQELKQQNSTPVEGVVGEALR